MLIVCVSPDETPELLTGQTPFDGPPVSQIYHHMNTEPPAPSTLDPRVPRDLQTICLKVLEAAGGSLRVLPGAGRRSALLDWRENRFGRGALVWRSGWSAGVAATRPWQD